MKTEQAKELAEYIFCVLSGKSLVKRADETEIREAIEEILERTHVQNNPRPKSPC